MLKSFGLAGDRKIIAAVLVKFIRLMVADYCGATYFYMQLAESNNDKLVQQVLTDIVDKERCHADEFLWLLRHLAPDEQKCYEEGTEEVQ